MKSSFKPYTNRKQKLDSHLDQFEDDRLVFEDIETVRIERVSDAESLVYELEIRTNEDDLIDTIHTVDCKSKYIRVIGNDRGDIFNEGSYIIDIDTDSVKQPVMFKEGAVIRIAPYEQENPCVCSELEEYGVVAA